MLIAFFGSINNKYLDSSKCCDTKMKAVYLPLFDNVNRYLGPSTPISPYNSANLRIKYEERDKYGYLEIKASSLAGVRPGKSLFRFIDANSTMRWCRFQ